mgnify:FL=1
MIRVTCFIRPHKLEEVKTAIAELGISGMSVSDVRGRGNSLEQAGVFGGQEYLVALPVKAKLVVFAPDELQEPLIRTVLEHAWTGESGDGKIFVEPVEDAIRVRTGERGESAI